MTKHPHIIPLEKGYDYLLMTPFIDRTLSDKLKRRNRQRRPRQQHSVEIVARFRGVRSPSFTIKTSFTPTSYPHRVLFDRTSLLLDFNCFGFGKYNEKRYFGKTDALSAVKICVSPFIPQLLQIEKAQKNHITGRLPCPQIQA